MDGAELLRRRLDETLPRLAAEHDVPGASVAVWVDGAQVESTTGVINRRSAVPVRADALFMIQSITKVWTATLVLQLVDDGLLELDDPVQRHLPGFRTADLEVSPQITVRHLLTHTGGFEGDLWAPTTAADDALQRFVDDLVPTAQQRSTPGSQFSYCNAGYGVLGRVIEVLRGSTHEQALRHHLAEPLGLEEVAFSADQALAFRTAIGHARTTPDAPLGPLPVWAVMPPSNPAAGNQLAMSARALLSLGRLHCADGLAPDGTRLLSTAAARAMRERQVCHPASWGPTSGQGLGWFVSGRDGMIEHGGDAVGVASALHVVPERRVAVAVITNSDGGHALIHDLVGPLLADLAGVAPAPGPAVPPTSWRAAEPGRYVGRYETRVSRYDVSLDAEGRLWLEQSWLREGLSMTAVAGVAEETTRRELRGLDAGVDPAPADPPAGEAAPTDTARSAGAPVGSDVFAVIDWGAAVGKIEFLGRDLDGRAAFLHAGRAVPRVG